MTDSPLSPLSRIGKRLRKEAAAVGLDMKAMTIAPNLEDEDGPHHASAVFGFDENFEPEPPKDDEWEKLIEAQAKHDAEQRLKEVPEGLADLAKNLQEGNGIL